MFCPNCGKQAGEGGIFCSACGTRLPQVQQAQQTAARQVSVAPAMPQSAPPIEQFVTAQPAKAKIPVGYSELAFHPELLAAVARGRQSARKIWMWAIPVPFIFLTIAGLLFSDVGLPLGMVVGGFISLVIGAFYLYDGYSTKNDRPWEGVLVNKYVKERVRQGNDRYDNHIETQTYFDYYLEFHTSAGEKKEIVEHDNGRRYYDYLRVGDYVRYHPQLNNFYEKYDKSHDKYLICPVCGKESKSSRDRCKYCNNILVK